MKIGVVDVGGGLRDIYGVGIFDFCLDNNLNFDLGIGVSAGGANLASFVARQRGRNYKFYTEYSFRHKYMSLRNYILHHSFVDLDYVYSTLSNSNGEYPLDYPTLAKNEMQLYIIATIAKTGAEKLFSKADLKQDNYDILKATAAIPVFCKPYVIDEVAYYDGALANPVPVQEALDLGCDKIILILTKPRDTIRKSEDDAKIANHLAKKYPEAAKGLNLRAKRYNEGVALAKKLEQENKALILAPADTFGVDTLSKSKEALIKLYQEGYNDAKQILDFLK